MLASRVHVAGTTGVIHIIYALVTKQYHPQPEQHGVSLTNRSMLEQKQPPLDVAALQPEL
jgi:hypothetical protein